MKLFWFFKKKKRKGEYIALGNNIIVQIKNIPIEEKKGSLIIPTNAYINKSVIVVEIKSVGNQANINVNKGDYVVVFEKALQNKINSEIAVINTDDVLAILNPNYLNK